MKNKQQLYIVSNRLPVKLGEDGKLTPTTGGLASALCGIGDTISSTWIGWAGTFPESDDSQRKLTERFESLSMIPVFLSEEEVELYYEGYSNRTLWPLLHGMTDRATFSDNWFATYKDVNLKFARQVASVADKGDMVWIHDYHFFMLPELLKEMRPDLKVGFFLHTPFCSSEVFRFLPERKAILKGIVSADLIGFHTLNYMRHFRSSMMRYLNIVADLDQFRYNDSLHTVGSYPIGHNLEEFVEACTTKEFIKTKKELTKELHGRKLVLSVERLDYTKGIPEKLNAIEYFLENLTDTEDVCFYIIAVPSRESVDEYAQLTEEVQQRVGEINGRFGSLIYQPIRLFNQGFSKAAVSALYSDADVCLVTPLSDGMNLVAKEYVAVKNKERGDQAGQLILSEFAGAASEMSEAILVNPYDARAVAEAISESFSVTDKEKWHKTHVMQSYLENHHAGIWAANFVKALSQHDEMSDNYVSVKGLTQVVEAVSSAASDDKKIAMFLDYDGTLRDFTAEPEAATPDHGLLQLLNSLSKSVDLAIVSGRPAKFLQTHFSNLNLTLVAEHGYRIKKPDSGKWQVTTPHIHTDWQDAIAPLLEQATAETPGATIERKASAIVWHYRNADPDYGSWQAKRLLEELTDLTAGLPVEICHGNKIVEVVSQHISKGLAVNLLCEGWNPDLVLSAGDDVTDESMFDAECGGAEHLTVYTGSKVTKAKYASDIKGLRECLEQISGILNTCRKDKVVKFV